MGTTSTALFSDDVACDVRNDFVDLLARYNDSARATAALLKTSSSTIQDADDGPVFWLALAATQWKYGCLTGEVKASAIDVIDNGADLKRWSGASVVRRSAVLLALKEKLLAPQPAPRQPRRRKTIVVPSVKLLSPDGCGLATAFELAPSSVPDAPRMQVLVELLVDDARGGGGVFMADCSYDEVALHWLDAEALQIRYPSSAAVSSKSTSLFFCGRTIRIEYELKCV